MQATGEAVACLAALAGDLAASVRLRNEEEEDQQARGRPVALDMGRSKQDDREMTACRAVVEQLVQGYAAACKAIKEEASRVSHSG